MKHLFRSFVSLSAFLLVCLTGLSDAAQLKFDRLEAKAELAPGEEQARASFKVTNEGDETVRIARVKTSCGCTGSILDRKILEPGQTTEIIATFNKGKRKGINTNRLEVYLDSQPDAVATLRFTVQIPELIKAQPEIIYWNASAAKSPRVVKITFDERYIDQITEIAYDNNSLTLTQEPDLKGSANILLTIEPKIYTKQLRQTITVKATGKDAATHESRIHVFVQP